MIAPAGNVEQAIRFYMYQQGYLHPQDGETAESIRRGMEFFSYTNNNITAQRIQRILEISRLPKYEMARDWFEKHTMNPAHPAYRKLKMQVWSELGAGGLQAPILIVWGYEDPEGSFPAGLKMFESLAAVTPQARFHAFARSGHVPYMEYPEEFNELVIGFIAAARSNAH